MKIHGIIVGLLMLALASTAQAQQESPTPDTDAPQGAAHPLAKNEAGLVNEEAINIENEGNSNERICTGASA